MRLKTTLAGLLIAFLLDIHGFSQVSNRNGTNPQIQAILNKTTLYINNDYAKIEGDPFVDKEFQKGILQFKNSVVVSDIPIRLNHYTDQIEFKENNKILGLANPEDIIQAQFGTHTFIYSEFKVGNKNKDGYFEVLANGKVKLLCRRESIVKREQIPASDYSGGNFRDYFRTTKEYYLKKGDEPAHKIMKSQKSVFKFLPEKETELKIYIKSQHLRINKDKDLIKLINYYNSIS